MSAYRARLAGTAFVMFILAAAAWAENASERLTSRPRPAAAAGAKLEVGAEVRTQAGQRRRIALQDGSVLFLNQNTQARLDGDRCLTLKAGEVFVEAARADAAFEVRSGQRTVTTRAGNFAVRGDQSVLVTAGQVQVGDVAVRAGEQLPAAAAKPTAAPRLTQPLEWLREPLAAAAPLVPANPHAGGALVALDPNGQEAKLSLRNYRIDAHVEDGFARTTIDQTFFNEEPTRLEGTFYFPLPADASLSRLAMYVDGNLMEGGMAERDHARTVYETIVHQRKDPALLEWIDGSTFKMRVFPLEPRQEKRIVLSYTQQLPNLYGRLTYRFPAGHSLPAVRDWSFHAHVKNGAGLTWASDSHTLKAIKDGGDLILSGAVKNVAPNRDVALSLEDPAAKPETDQARFSSAEQDGARYLMVRYRPQLSVPQTVLSTPKRDLVFLVETSGDRDPLLARTQIEVVRELLNQAGPEDSFAILAANTRARAFAPEARPVTPENAVAGLKFLEDAHLIGALDLDQALTEAARLLKASKNAYLVHVGSGVPALGERRTDELARRLPAGTRYVGVGVGKRWNRTFMKATAEKTGGLFTQINPDEPIAWRAFELAATLDTPRLLDVKVVDPTDKVRFLGSAAAVAQGEEVTAIARIDGGALPESVLVTGVLSGKPQQRLVKVENVRPDAGYLPRTWARLEIERLLAEDAVKHKEPIVALSKAMYVMTPFTSLLVLENEAMYEQYKVDRGRKDHWAIYPCPAKVPVVYEPLPGMPADVNGLTKNQKPNAQQVAGTVRTRATQPISYVSDAAPRGFVTGLTPSGNFTHDLDIPLRNSSAGQAIPPFGEPWGTLPNQSRAGEFTQYKALSDVEDFGQILSKSPALHKPLSTSGIAGVRFEPNSEYRRLGLQSGGNVSLRATPGPIEMFDMSGSMSAASNGRHGPVSLMFGLGLNFDGEAPDRIAHNPNGGQSPGLLYHRPSFQNEDRIYFDLVAYCPGMNSSRADVQAVIDAEAAPDFRIQPGKIDAAARGLFERAATTGWRAWTLPGEKDRPELAIFFDGQGRYAGQRQLPLGLREQVVSDGQTILHLYPDLGIGARRTISRFHRLELAQQVPWFLPPPEDLARGADLISVDEQTVALVAHGAGKKDDKGEALPSVQLRFVFASDGRLSERQIVEMPAGKVLRREVLAADGTVRVLDKDDKEVAVTKGKLRAAEAPDLKPNIKDLVVLSLPYRSVEFVRQQLQEQKKDLNQVKAEEALPLFAALFAANQGDEAYNVFQNHFRNRNHRQLGYYVLLAACGQQLDGEHRDILADHPEAPLAQYLALYTSPVLRKHASQWAVGIGQWKDGHLRHLAVTHALLQRWQTGKALLGDAPQRETEMVRALEYIDQNCGTAFAWALACLMQDRFQVEENNKKDVRADWARLAGPFRLFEEMPGLAYAARYEAARCQAKGGAADKARTAFRTLYEEAIKEGALPPIDADFRQALLGDGKGADPWGDLIRQAGAHFLKEKRRFALLALARQCQQVGDQALAQHLVDRALDGSPDKEQLPLTWAAMHLLLEIGQPALAETRLRDLLGDPKQAESATLWRLGVTIAQRRGQKARELECLEKALDAEYRDQPEVINLQTVRDEYGRLLAHYQQLAESMTALQLKPPADFQARVVRAADRWRALDANADSACQTAAQILRELGQRDLAWDYLTTPVAQHPGEAAPLTGLARSLGSQGELDLADRAFAAAFAAEPTDAQILWDRAQNLRQAGKPLESQKLFRQLAEGPWQPRFQGLQAQARWQLEGR